MSDAVVARLEREYDDILERLKTFIRLPSVSADPAYAQGMHDTRDFLMARLTELGLENVQLLDGGGQAAVYASWTGAPGKPTLIIYGHYDVQPPDPLDLWKSPPFEPTIRDNRLYARGASDVKGTTLIAIETIGAFLAEHGACPVNVKFFLEGEEETGSPSLIPIVDKYRDLLQADAVLSADGGRQSAEIPAINVGARGIAKLELTLRTAAKDLHSGRFGGATRNALHEIAQPDRHAARRTGPHRRRRLRRRRHGDDQRPARRDRRLPLRQGRVLRELRRHRARRARIHRARTPDAAPDARRERPVGRLHRAWQQDGDPLRGPRQIHHAPRPRPDSSRVAQTVIDHLRAHAPSGVTLDFVAHGGGSPASSLPPDHWLLLACERVLEQTTGHRPIRVRIGGTLPITAIFQEKLGIDTVMFGFATADEDIHSPNEFFRLSSLEGSLWPMLLSDLSQIDKKAC